MFNDENDYSVASSEPSYDVYTQEPIKNSNTGGGLAVAAFVLSIIGFLTGCFLLGVLLDILAIILAIVALAGKKSHKGLSIAAIIIAMISIITTIAVYAFVISNEDFQREFKDAFWSSYNAQLDKATGDDSYDSNTDVSIMPDADTETAVTTEPPVSTSDMTGITIADSEYTAGLNVSYQGMADGDVFFLIQNTNSVDLSLSGEFTYTDADSNVVGDGYFTVTRLPAGATTAAVAYAPYDDEFNQVPYSAIAGEIVPSAIEADSDAMNYGHLDAVTVNSAEATDQGVDANITTNEDLSSAVICCVFMNGDTAVGYSTQYQDDCTAGSSYDVSFYGPMDAEYNDVAYDSYQVFVMDTLPVYE